MSRYLPLVILGILAVLYGLLVSMAGSGMGFFMVWIAMGAALEMTVLIRFFGFWEMLPVTLRMVFRAAVTVFVMIFVVVEAVIFSGFLADHPPDLDYIIVLGAQVRQDGPSVVLRYRLDRAAGYLLVNSSTLCIVSGGQGMNEPWSEAEGMRRYLLEKGIAGHRILLEDKSESTAQNLKNCSEMINFEKDAVGIVTNNFHMYRAMRIACKAGFVNVYAIPAPSSVLYLPNNMLREFMGVMKDFVMGNI